MRPATDLTTPIGPPPMPIRKPRASTGLGSAVTTRSDSPRTAIATRDMAPSCAAESSARLRTPNGTESSGFYWGDSRLITLLVMPGLAPAIHVFAATSKKDVDGRDKPGHDEDDLRRRHDL